MLTEIDEIKSTVSINSKDSQDPMGKEKDGYQSHSPAFSIYSTVQINSKHAEYIWYPFWMKGLFL